MFFRNLMNSVESVVLEIPFSNFGRSGEGRWLWMRPRSPVATRSLLPDLAAVGFSFCDEC